MTVCAVGALVPAALDAAGRLAEDGIDVEVWDPRSLLPFDKEGLAASVAKTGRLVIADDSARTCGFAAGGWRGSSPSAASTRSADRSSGSPEPT